MGSICLYMILTILSACLCGLVQTLGKVYLGQWSSFVSNGDNFRYNYVVYFIGLVLFLASLNILYKLILKKKFESTEFYSTDKTVAVIIVVVGCILMFAALIMGAFAVLGMTDNLGPYVLFYLTLIGWPVGTLIYMLVKIMLDM